MNGELQTAPYITPSREIERALALAGLAALAAAAGIVEGFITLPLPFVRLGLANAFVLVALWRWGPGGGLVVGAMKVFGAALLLGTLFSPVFPMDAGGTLASIVVMVAVGYVGNWRPGVVVVASALGGVAHAGWQVLYLDILAGGDTAFYLAPALLTWGLAAGVVVGLVAKKLLASKTPGGARR